ncbi:MAG: Amino acid adenylation domain protein, partial [Pedosphaera sp.]|nr:Amino acid adenylation domain protein [Pedosphaera sp.]
GYLISCRNELATTSDVKKFLLTKLPDYMVPASFVWLHRMPLTVNGKLDRNALPAPTQQRPELDQAYVAPATELEQFLAGIWRELLGLDQVGVHDKFFELGGDSIQGAEFIAQVEKKLGEQIYVVVLFKAPTVAGFSAYLEKNYPSAMARIFPSSAENAHAKSAEDETPRKIDAGILAQARRVIPSLAPRTYPGTGKNPPAMFILAPPRSGTSLLRVMLAGNPQIFATSELHLLGFNTLAERKAAFTGNYSLWLEGLVRTVMEIKKCNAEEATRIMEGYESGDLPTKQFYGLLQEWIGQRLLVEKTPGYALNMEILHRAEADFSNPLYIHLVRNPLAMVRSFEKNHLDQVYFTYQHSFSSRQLGELFWLIANQNISEFLKNIPLHRQFYMRFEELVTQPREIMEQMCRRFGLEFHEDMVQPYKDPEKKMLDGVHAQSRSMTDANFFKYKGIEAGTAQALMAAEEDFLGELTWELAKQFGYNRNIGATSSREFLIGERRRLRQACRQNLTIHRNSNE